jgi:hypothetical protein
MGLWFDPNVELCSYASNVNHTGNTSACVTSLNELQFADTRLVDDATSVVLSCMTLLSILVRRVATMHHTTGKEQHVLQIMQI